MTTPLYESLVENYRKYLVSFSNNYLVIKDSHPRYAKMVINIRNDTMRLYNQYIQLLTYLEGLNNDAFYDNNLKYVAMCFDSLADLCLCMRLITSIEKNT